VKPRCEIVLETELHFAPRC